MDSLTQIVLGAACGELVLGKKAGNKAQLYGAIAGTLPDLDVLGNLWYRDDLAEIALHRGYSHAWFVHLLIAFPLAWLTFRLHKRRYTYKDWYFLWFLGLSTHALLDAFTTYGTRLFLPFTHYPVGFNNISVIDPFYTLPFMGLLAVCLFMKRDNPRRLIWAKRAVYLSSFYMLCTFGVKAYVHREFAQELKAGGIAYTELKTSPAFFSNFLWSGLAISDSMVYVGEYSILQDEPGIQFVAYKRNLHLEAGFRGEVLSTLRWFSQGAYLLEPAGADAIAFYVVKWGRTSFRETRPEKSFVFHYRISRQAGQLRMKTIRPSFGGAEMKQAFSDLFNRIFHKPVLKP